MSCTITKDERSLLVSIERGGPHGSARMARLTKAAKGLIAKGLAAAGGSIGGGYFVRATVAGDKCLGIDWDNGPRPKYNAARGEHEVRGVRRRRRR